MNITLDNARIAVKAALEEGIVPGKPCILCFLFCPSYWVDGYHYSLIYMF